MVAAGKTQVTDGKLGENGQSRLMVSQEMSHSPFCERARRVILGKPWIGDLSGGHIS